MTKTSNIFRWINYIITIKIAILIGFCLLGYLISFGLDIKIFGERLKPEGFAFGGLILALWTGLYQMLVSLINLFRKGTKSELAIHFFISIAVLASFGILVNMGNTVDQREFYWLIAMILPAALAIYHIYISLTDLKPFQTKKDILDL